MKITRCKYGHYYDKAYFKECPHCCRKRGGRDEDIIIKKADVSMNSTDESRRRNLLQDENNSDKKQSQKEKDREKVKRWIGEAWDELEDILSEGGDGSSEHVYREEKENIYGEKGIQEEKVTTEKAIKGKERTKTIEAKEKIEKNKKSDVSVNKKEENVKQDLDEYMLFAAMPLKVIKNQEFCIDFCIFPEREWETGAKMLSFKSQESIRDLKPVQMALPANVVLRILYKEEEIYHKEMNLSKEKKNIFCTFPVTVTDTRDRRFHMVKAVFEVKDQSIEIPLYLMPNP